MFEILFFFKVKTLFLKEKKILTLEGNCDHELDPDVMG